MNYLELLLGRGFVEELVRFLVGLEGNGLREVILTMLICLVEENDSCKRICAREDLGLKDYLLKCEEELKGNESSIFYVAPCPSFRFPFSVPKPRISFSVPPIYLPVRFFTTSGLILSEIRSFSFRATHFL